MKSPRKQPKPISVVAANLVALRKARGWTQQQLADRLGTDLSKIARTEVGILKASVELVEQVIEKLDVTADELFRNPRPLSPAEQEVTAILTAIRKLTAKQRGSVKLLLDGFEKGQFTKVIVADKPVEGPGIDHT